MKKKHKKKIKFVLSNMKIFLITIAVVMIWRGIWNFLDMYFLTQNPFASNLLSILFWTLLIFILNFDLKELEN